MYFDNLSTSNIGSYLVNFCISLELKSTKNHNSKPLKLEKWQFLKLWILLKLISRKIWVAIKKSFPVTLCGNDKILLLHVFDKIVNSTLLLKKLLKELISRIFFGEQFSRFSTLCACKYLGKILFLKGFSSMNFILNNYILFFLRFCNILFKEFFSLF